MSAQAELDLLREEVRALSDSAAARFSAEGWHSAVHDDPTLIAVGLRVTTLRDILSSAASLYLRDVRLHLRPDVVVRAGDDVRVRIGPVSVHAGRWDLAVTVRRVDALLSAGAIDLATGDSTRIDLVVPVHVSDATGDAFIDFEWDARTITGIVCSDFTVREAFAAYVLPRTYEMRGHIVVEADGGQMIARPVLLDRIFVSPQPTAQSWERIREILLEQDRIFACGLAISPERMEGMLRDLLTRGFRFSLPASILRPLPLPSSVLDEVAVAGRSVAVTVLPEAPLLIGDRLWLRAAVHATALGDATIRVEARAPE